MKHSEPPSAQSCTQLSLFLVGRNSWGNWVVQDQAGLCGGLFVNCAEAVKFARRENGNQPQAIVMVSRVLELDMSSGALPAGHQPLSSAQVQRVA